MDAEQRATAILRLAAFCDAERLLLRPLLWWIERSRAGNDTDEDFPLLLAPEVKAGYDILLNVRTRIISDSASSLKKGHHNG